MMLESQDPLAKLLAEDKRYRVEAYAFVWDALNYAQSELGMGAGRCREEPEASAAEEEPEQDQHLTGQELCEAIRRYGLEQYGFMAKTVFNSWGVAKTGDFGEIVFNFIRVGKMKKTSEDRREDFDDVFDFETGLVQDFKITLPE